MKGGVWRRETGTPHTPSSAGGGWVGTSGAASVAAVGLCADHLAIVVQFAVNNKGELRSRYSGEIYAVLDRVLLPSGSAIAQASGNKIPVGNERKRGEIKRHPTTLESGYEVDLDLGCPKDISRIDVDRPVEGLLLGPDAVQRRIERLQTLCSFHLAELGIQFQLFGDDVAK